MNVEVLKTIDFYGISLRSLKDIVFFFVIIIIRMQYFSILLTKSHKFLVLKIKLIVLNLETIMGHSCAW